MNFDQSRISGHLRRLSGSLRSRNPAARQAILRKLVKPVCRGVDSAARQISLLRSSSEQDQTIPKCLMIVSPPRSGGTVIYQFLTRAIPSTYISNLHDLFPFCAAGMMRHRQLLGEGIDGLKNYYGHTAKLNDVNEGNDWMEWILSHPDDAAGIRRRFARFVAAMQPTDQTPLFWKNVGAYSRLSQLHRAVPEIVFLRIRRSQQAVVESELCGFHELGTFNPVPEALLGRVISDPLEFVVEQIQAIEAELDRAASIVPRGQWHEWEYESFCEQPWPLIEKLARDVFDIPSSQLCKSKLPAQLTPSQRKRVSEDETERLRFLLKNRERRAA